MRQFIIVPIAVLLSAGAASVLARPETQRCFFSVDGRRLVDRP